MSTGLKQLVSLLVEQALAEDDAPANAIFGKWLFGPNQLPYKDEPNTELEKKFDQLLYHHFEDRSIGASKELADFYFKHVKPEVKKGNYTQYLAPPNAVVYRGMILKGVIRDINKKNAKLVRTEDSGFDGLEFRTYIAPGGVLNTKMGTMSWSLKKTTASSFSFPETYGMPGQVSAIFKANTSDSQNNFFFNPIETKGKFRAHFSAYAHEMEVISIGSVHYDEVEYTILKRTRRK